MSPDGKMVASCSLDHTLCLWEASTGKLLSRREDDRGEYWPGDLLFSPDSKAFAFGHFMGELYLYDTKTGARKGVFVPPLIHPDLAAGLVFQSGPFSPLAPLEASLHLVERTIDAETTSEVLQFSANGKTLLTRQSDGSLCWWNVETGKPTRRVPPRGVNVYHDLASNGQRYATFSTKRLVEPSVTMWMRQDQAAFADRRTTAALGF